ncbi:BON domain-containing protein [Altererythrobacter aerius]|uniref:BON domain-containing protein n=2 Tax=Tsuneonella aeria TaxID=1837929 RepID=A0A6I4TCJ8_9SPHN|nr:BON domain-containing protein [Tsuneonella aeria]
MSDHGAWGGGGMERRGYGAQHDRFAQGAYGDSHRSSFGSSQRDRGMGWSGGGYGGAYDDRSRASSAYGLQGDSGYGATYGRADNRSVHGRSGSWDDSGHDRGFFERASDEVASWFGDEDAARRRKQDHRGNGPANYNRSDERVLEDACDRLTEDWTLDARNIQVTVHEGEVTLDGTVDSRQAKRRAEDLVEDLSGVKHVQNNLRVQTTGTSGLASNESPRMGGNAELSRTGSGTAES